MFRLLDKVFFSNDELPIISLREYCRQELVVVNKEIYVNLIVAIDHHLPSEVSLPPSIHEEETNKKQELY